MLENHKNKLCERYKIEESSIEEKLQQEQPENENIYEIMLEIGRKRGCIIARRKHRRRKNSKNFTR